LFVNQSVAKKIRYLSEERIVGAFRVQELGDSNYDFGPFSPLQRKREIPDIRLSEERSDCLAREKPHACRVVRKTDFRAEISDSQKLRGVIYSTTRGCPKDSELGIDRRLRHPPGQRHELRHLFS
jgi:hypothetical protein